MIILKSSQEIEKIRASGRVAWACLNYLETKLAPGITTGQLDQWAVEFMKAHHAKAAPFHYKGYPKSICVSINDEVVHGIPGARVIHTGDIFTIDITTIVDGYHGDTARTYAFPPINHEAQRLIDATKKALFMGIEAAQPGKRLGDVGWTIQSFIEAQGFSVVRDFVGHGLGQSFHEDPQVAHYGKAGTGVLLRPGMVFTIEPMINAGGPDIKVLSDKWTAVTRDHSLAAQFEHTVAITAAGPVILTDGS